MEWSSAEIWQGFWFSFMISAFIMVLNILKLTFGYEISSDQSNYYHQGKIKKMFINIIIFSMLFTFLVFIINFNFIHIIGSIIFFAFISLIAFFDPSKYFIK